MKTKPSDADAVRLDIAKAVLCALLQVRGEPNNPSPEKMTLVARDALAYADALLAAAKE